MHKVNLNSVSTREGLPCAYKENATMKHDPKNPNKNLHALRAEVVNNVIQYMPRGTSTVCEGVRRFKVKSISHCYTHKQSGNVLMQCKVYDRNDHGKLKDRSLNVELYTVES
jgi:hypothetical protein